MTFSNQKKAAQLGMPFGTACHRLRQSLLFSLVERLGENVCFKCGGEIENIGQLSLEHKQVWLDVDPDLFWDLENVTFSHRSCNKAERTGRNKKIGPAGTKWCSGHREFHPIDSFYTGVPSEGTSRYYCKEYRKEYRKQGNKD